MDNEGKILAGLGGFCLFVGLFVPWVGDFTALDVFAAFTSVHLPFVVGSLLIALRQVVPALVRVSSVEVDRLLLVLAGLALLAITLSGSSDFGISWGPGFWVTWLLVAAGLVVVFAGGKIGLSQTDGASLAGGPVAAPYTAGSYTAAPGPGGATLSGVPAPNSYAAPTPVADIYAPAPAPAADTYVAGPAPAPVEPDGQVAEPAGTWVAVPPGTVSSGGQMVPSGEWLALVSRSSATVIVRTEAGTSYEVPAQTSFIRP